MGTAPKRRRRSSHWLAISRLKRNAPRQKQARPLPWMFDRPFQVICGRILAYENVYLSRIACVKTSGVKGHLFSGNCFQHISVALFLYLLILLPSFCVSIRKLCRASSQVDIYLRCMTRRTRRLLVWTRLRRTFWRNPHSNFHTAIKVLLTRDTQVSF
jgi:hypothetical protein